MIQKGIFSILADTQKLLLVLVYDMTAGIGAELNCDCDMKTEEQTEVKSEIVIKIGTDFVCDQMLKPVVQRSYTWAHSHKV